MEDNQRYPAMGKAAKWIYKKLRPQWKDIPLMGVDVLDITEAPLPDYAGIDPAGPIHFENMYNQAPSKWNLLRASDMIELEEPIDGPVIKQWHQHLNGRDRVIFNPHGAYEGEG